MTGAGARRAARPPVVTAVAVLAVLGALGSAAMTAFHVDLYRSGALPLFVPLGFALGTLAFAACCFGVLRRAAWAWPVAVVVNGLGFVSAAFPWRGVQALLPMAVTLLALVLLVGRAGRRALLGAGQPTGSGPEVIPGARG